MRYLQVSLMCIAHFIIIFLGLMWFSCSRFHCWLGTHCTPNFVEMELFVQIWRWLKIVVTNLVNIGVYIEISLMQSTTSCWDNALSDRPFNDVTSGCRYNISDTGTPARPMALVSLVYIRVKANRDYCPRWEPMEGQVEIRNYYVKQHRL
jgi:hypothetical protein